MTPAIIQFSSLLTDITSKMMFFGGAVLSSTFLLLSGNMAANNSIQQSTSVSDLFIAPVPFPNSIQGYNSSFVLDNGAYNDSDPIVQFHLQALFDQIPQENDNPLIFENVTLYNSLETISDIQINYNSSVPLHSEIDESYILKVGPGKVVIDSPTNWGAVNALKTLKQLIYRSDGHYSIQQVDIDDKPMLAHRGILIDSSRNYLTVDIIKSHLELMAINKMNVLHWHFEDSQSWPLQLNLLDVLEPYSPEEIYSQADIKELIQFAYYRGVRIIPELEMPGHAKPGYEKVDPNMVVCGSPPNDWHKNAGEPPAGQLNIAYDNTFNVVKQIYDELDSLFPDNVIHLGHDEVNEYCYQNAPDTSAWLKQNKGTLVDLLNHWVQKLLPILSSSDNTTDVEDGQKRFDTIIMWEDVISTYNLTIPKDIVLQNWLGLGNVKNLISRGHKVIVSSSQYYYLDCGFGQFLVDSTSHSWCDPYKSWQILYTTNFMSDLDELEKKSVLGAEVALWGELVDSNNFMNKAWPRTIAFAESLWYGNDDIIAFAFRFFRFKDYLNKLGYQLGPLVPQYCARDPTKCV